MNQIKCEEWRDISEFRGIYQVSDLGRVKSIERRINTRVYKAQIMKPFTGNNGSLFVRLRNGTGAQYRRSIAKLVLLEFVGQPPKMAKQAKHLDSDNKNNKLENLAWDVSSTYFMTPNTDARTLLETDAYKNIDDYIRLNKLKTGLNFAFTDKDDFKQICALKIWNSIDKFSSEKSLFRAFCFKICRDEFNRYYRKYIKKRALGIEDIFTESKPNVDYFKELSYSEDYDDD